MTPSSDDQPFYHLSKGDRLASLVIGLAVIAFALLGEHDKNWMPVVLGVVGLLSLIGGLGGT